MSLISTAISALLGYLALTDLQLQNLLIYIVQPTKQALPQSIAASLWQLLGYALAWLAVSFLLTPLLYGVVMQVLFTRIDGRSQTLAESRPSISQSWKALGSRKGSILLLNLRGFLLGLGLTILVGIGAYLLQLILSVPMALFPNPALASMLLGMFLPLSTLLVSGVAFMLQLGAIIPPAVEGLRGGAALQRRRSLYHNSRASLWRTGLKISVLMGLVPALFGLVYGTVAGVSMGAGAPSAMPFLAILTYLYALLIAPLLWCMVAKTHLEMAERLAEKTSQAD